MLISYFTGAEPVELLRTYNRFTNVTNADSTWRDVPGRRLTDADLWILTNANSASAAEMFAYAVQRIGRGTVVGETTAGAGNGGAKLSVGAGLALFVPSQRIVSGPGYESTGVVPDIATFSDSAPAVAHRSALERLAAKRAPETIARERAWALEMARASKSPSSGDASRLARYAGMYGTRTVRVTESRLESVGSTGWVTRLTPLGDDHFGTADARYRFERNALGAPTALVVETIDGKSARLERVR
jgi:hypothetical protein